MKHRVRLKPKVRYYRSKGQRIIFKTVDYRLRNKACAQITKEGFLKRKKAGYKVGRFVRIPHIENSLWWIDYSD